MRQCYREMVPIIGPLTYHWSSFTFNNGEMIKDVECPLFLYHGDKDKLIGPNHSFKLAKIVLEQWKDMDKYKQCCKL